MRLIVTVLACAAGTALLAASPSFGSSIGPSSCIAWQDANSPQQKLMAQRAATLDAYRLLAERILGLELRSATTVEDFVLSSDEIRSRVEGFLRGARIVAVRYYSDGSCEVDAEVTVREVVDELKKVVQETNKDGPWKTEEIEEIVRRTKDTVIQVTGGGAARPNSTVPDPATSRIIGGGPSTGSAIEVKLPPIYSKYPPAERLKAKRAAELDAYRKLIERIKGLELSSTTKVGDFILEQDVVRTAVEGRLKGMNRQIVRYCDDGVVEVEISVTIQQVIETIKKVRDEVYEDGRWKTEEFADIRKNTVRKVVTVVGTGALGTPSQSTDERFDSGDPEIIIVED